MIANYLAELFGISIVVISLAILIKPNYLRILFTKVEDEATMFCWGIMTLVIGIAMILAYNIWAKNWQVIITIIGWLALVKGLALLFVPELVKNYAKKIQNKQWLPIVLVVMVFVGLIITYLGFTA